MKAETVATITIDDVNDNAPVFDPSSYSETIPETLPLGDTAVEVMATDADLKLTHEVSFVIVSGNTDDAFAVYTDTPTLRGLIYPQKVKLVLFCFVVFLCLLGQSCNVTSCTFNGRLNVRDNLE